MLKIELVYYSTNAENKDEKLVNIINWVMGLQEPPPPP